MVLGMAPTNFISSPRLVRCHVRAAALALAVSVLVLGCGADDDSGVGVEEGQRASQSSTVGPEAPEPGNGKMPGEDSSVQPPSMPTPEESVVGERPTLEPAWEPTAVPQTFQTPSLGGSGTPDDTPGTAIEGGNSPGEPPGANFSYGGLLLLPDPGPFWRVANEVLDLCDDSIALNLVMGRALAPGETASEEDLLEMQFLRAAQGAECDEPGGNRYVHMSDFGYGLARPTVQEAVEWHRQRNQENLELFGDSWRRFPDGDLLGYYGDLRREFPLEDQDSVVVLHDTVSLQDGTVRGLVHNLSRTQYARDLVVSAVLPESGGGLEDARGASALVWRWPLTVQPGERAPFEIAGWAAADPPGVEDLSISASLSPTPDIKRSFVISVNHLRSFLDLELHRMLWPESTLAAEEIPTDEVDYNSAVAELIVPESHPELANQVLNQEIQDGRIFIATMDNRNKTVVDVVEFTFTAEEDTPITRMFTAFLPGGLWQVWAGGANPPPDQQPTRSQTTE